MILFGITVRPLHAAEKSSGPEDMPETFISGDAAKGSSLVASCAACHGSDGNSINTDWPKLAGQNSEVEIDIASNYAAEDADITLKLFNKLDELLIDKPNQVKLLKELEYPLVHVLSRVEQNGAKIDKDKLKEHSKELSEKIADLTTQAYKISGAEFNLDSPKQLLEVLYEKLKLPVLKKTPKGQLFRKN